MRHGVDDPVASAWPKGVDGSCRGQGGELTVDCVADIGVGGREADFVGFAVIEARTDEQSADLFGAAEAADTLAPTAGVDAELAAEGDAH